MDNYIEKFDAAKTAVTEIKTKIDGLVITDQGTRDQAFEMAKEASKISKMVSDRRIEIQKPLKAEKKRLKDQLEKDLEPIEKGIKDVETYAKTILQNVLDESITKKKQNILDWDKKIEVERARRRREIEEQEQKEREEAERVAEEERQKIAEEERKVEEAKQAKINKKKGVERALAIKEEEKRAEEERERLKKEAEERETQRVIDEQVAKVKRENDLAEINKKSKGREKIVNRYSIRDLDQIPGKYLIKTVNWELVKTDIEKNNIESIPGIRIISERQLMFK